MVVVSFIKNVCKVFYGNMSFFKLNKINYEKKIRIMGVYGIIIDLKNLLL